MNYPPDDRKKGNLWVLRFIKLTYRVDLAMELGPQAALLLQYVALGEDRCDFLKPPMYFSKELMTACGVRDNEAFKSTRDRCVAAGWMVYQAGGIRQAGAFWVTVPEAFQEVMGCKSSCGKTASSPDHDRIMTGASPDHDRIATGLRPVADRFTTGIFLPSPLSPVPKRERAPALTDGQVRLERLKKEMRRIGLPTSEKAIEEWADFLPASCGCKSIEDCIWALRWVNDQGLLGGIEIKFAPQAKHLARACKRELFIFRKEQQAKQEAKS